MKPQDFYNNLSPDYDRMIRFNQRLESERPVFENLLQRHPFSSALDAACGTGMHLVLLAKMGIDVVGADISTDMLERAGENLRQNNITAPLLQIPMQKLTERLDRKFDAVFCLGNSLPHLLIEEELDQALTGFCRLLNPGGILVCGMLNFNRIIKNGQRVLSVNRDGDMDFIRFYDFNENTIQFNILSIHWQNNKAEHALQNTELMPYDREFLEKKLNRSGFRKTEFYGSMRLENYSEEESNNLVSISFR